MASMDLTDEQVDMLENLIDSLVHEQMDQYEHFLVNERDFPDDKIWKLLDNKHNVAVYSTCHPSIRVRNGQLVVQRTLRHSWHSMTESRHSRHSRLLMSRRLSRHSSSPRPSSAQDYTSTTRPKHQPKQAKAAKGSKATKTKAARKSKTKTKDLDASQWPTLFVGISTSAGRMEDAVYGSMAPTTESLRWRHKMFPDSTILDGAVLRNLQDPDLINPLQSHTIQWLRREVSPKPFSSFVRRCCDFVYVDATGFTETSLGETIGFHLQHSIELPNDPIAAKVQIQQQRREQSHKQPSQQRQQQHHEDDIIHGKMSVCSFFRQVGTNYYQVVARAHVDSFDQWKNSMMERMSMRIVAKALIKHVHTACQSGPLKKLASQLQLKELLFNNTTSTSAAMLTSGANMGSHRYCALCKRSVGMLRKARECELCSRFVCSKCLTKQYVLNRYHKETLCLKCIKDTAQKNVLEMAREQLTCCRGPHQRNTTGAVLYSSFCHRSTQDGLEYDDESYNVDDLIDRLQLEEEELLEAELEPELVIRHRLSDPTLCSDRWEPCESTPAPMTTTCCMRDTSETFSSSWTPSPVQGSILHEDYQPQANSSSAYVEPDTPKTSFCSTDSSSECGSRSSNAMGYQQQLYLLLRRLCETAHHTNEMTKRTSLGLLQSQQQIELQRAAEQAYKREKNKHHFSKRVYSA